MAFLRQAASFSTNRGSVVSNSMMLWSLMCCAKQKIISVWINGSSKRVSISENFNHHGSRHNSGYSFSSVTISSTNAPSFCSTTNLRFSGWKSSFVRLVNSWSGGSWSKSISTHQQFSSAFGRFRWLTFSLSLRKMGITCLRKKLRGMLTCPQSGKSFRAFLFPEFCSPSSNSQCSPSKIPAFARIRKWWGSPKGSGVIPAIMVAGFSRKSFSISEYAWLPSGDTRKGVWSPLRILRRILRK